MADRLTPVEDLLKLVDACNRCSAAFRATDKHLSNLTFHQFCDRLERTMSRFIFELKKESSRIGSQDGRPSSAPEIPPNNAEALLVHAEVELQSTLDGYDACLTRPMPAHARAMLQRQRQSLGRLQADLDEMSGEGSASNF